MRARDEEFAAPREGPLEVWCGATSGRPAQCRGRAAVISLVEHRFGTEGSGVQITSRRSPAGAAAVVGASARVLAWVRGPAAHRPRAR